MKTLAFALLVSLLIQTDAFSTSSQVKVTRSSLQATSKPVDEAVAIYQKRYPDKGSKKDLFFTSWGVPKRDIDGSQIKKSKSTSGNKRIFDIDDKQQRASFQELARLYGAEVALQMTRDLPSILAFNSKNFKPSLQEFSKIFGQEEAKEMVARNPGLLAVSPANAAESDDQTMQFSYIVAKTRPLGDVLLFGTLGLLSIPALEALSGIPLRANILSTVLGN
jgi:hypothetical protein